MSGTRTYPDNWDNCVNLKGSYGNIISEMTIYKVDALSVTVHEVVHVASQNLTILSFRM